MFCSLKCRDKTYELFGDNLNDNMVIEYDQMYYSSDRHILDAQEAFGGQEELLEFLKENDIENSHKTIFDFDWRGEDIDKMTMKCCLSLDTRTVTFNDLKCFDIVPPSTELIIGKRELVTLALKLCKVRERYPIHTSHKLEMSVKILRFAATGSIISLAGTRNSCMPNVGVFSIGEKYYAYVRRPVKAGEEILMTMK